MSSRLYRATHLEPVQELFKPILLLNQHGFYKGKGSSPFMRITAIEPIQPLGAHGVLPLWAHAGVLPGGYGSPIAGQAPGWMLGGDIAAGGTSAKVVPTALQAGDGQLLQMRFLLRAVGLTGPVIDDFDLVTFSPVSVARAALQNEQGRWNAAFQMQMPADAIAGPAAGANMALPAAFPFGDIQDVAPGLTEIFSLEQQGPAFQLSNNGVITTGGMIGLNVVGFSYDLEPIGANMPNGSPRRDWYEQEFPGGLVMMAPPDWVAVPLAPTATHT